MDEPRSFEMGVAGECGVTVPYAASVEDHAAWPAVDDWQEEEDTPKPPDAGKGTLFDERLDFRDPEGDRFARRVVSAIEPIEQRRNARSKREEENHYLLLRKVLANGFRCLWHREPARVAYFRKADKYKSTPEWLSGRALARTVDLMEKTGLVETTMGGRAGRSFEDRSASSYRITKDLNAIAIEVGISNNSLVLPVSRERLVRLKSRGNSPQDVLYLPTPDTERWCNELAELNAFIALQELTTDLTAEQEKEWVAHANSQRGRSGMPLYRPERFRTELYRSFSAKFDQGGRLYGGWWIEAPSWVRSHIVINGRATIELDYSGYHTRMLYHQCGREYLDDPYHLEPVAALEQEAGVEARSYRETIKRLLNAMLNAEKGGRPANIICQEGLRLPPGITARKLRLMLEHKHRPIREAFCSGVGLRLQRADADIAMGILTGLRQQGIVALPVHDSFIVSDEHEAPLKEAMVACYKTVFGFDPVIERKCKGNDPAH